MSFRSPSSTFRDMLLSEKQRLFLDILKVPQFAYRDGWGAKFHAWLEEQAADGKTLGEIARRIDLPHYGDAAIGDSWQLLNEHVAWMIEHGYARVVRIEVVA